MTITLRQLADRNKFLLEFKTRSRRDPGNNVSLVLTRAEVTSLADQCHLYRDSFANPKEDSSNDSRI